MAVETQDRIVVACAKCTTANRIPRSRLGDGPRCGNCGAALLDGKPAMLEEAQFDRFLARTGLPVLVDFWADWCGPCHAMAPAFERAAAEFQTRAQFAKVNTERAQGIAGRYGIRSIPTLVLFRGAREQARISGAMDAGSIASWLTRNAGI
jgi:thioredoxin 2